MIDEAIGKILGMAMAYVASAMGMFVAYINYRKRIVKAEKVMTPMAWVVIAVTVAATLCGALIVTQMATSYTAEQPPAVEEAVAEAPQPETRAATERAADPERSRWTWIGIIVPAVIFLFATVVTTGLHRHFSTHGQ
ncbi:MAG: hypothetical protein OEM62_08595 [Acidobacteriota bacterium]|nr:hypothetical protein [Acidobacteriota bacterium]